MTTISKISSLDEIILNALATYVKNRADEIVEKHKLQAIEEIEKSVRQEVSRVVMEVGAFVSFQRDRREVIIKIADYRQDEKK